MTVEQHGPHELEPGRERRLRACVPTQLIFLLRAGSERERTCEFIRRRRSRARNSVFITHKRTRRFWKRGAASSGRRELDAVANARASLACARAKRAQNTWTWARSAQCVRYMFQYFQLSTSCRSVPLTGFSAFRIGEKSPSATQARAEPPLHVEPARNTRPINTPASLSRRSLPSAALGLSLAHKQPESHFSRHRAPTRSRWRSKRQGAAAVRVLPRERKRAQQRTRPASMQWHWTPSFFDRQMRYLAEYLRDLTLSSIRTSPIDPCAFSLLLRCVPHIPVPLSSSPVRPLRCAPAKTKCGWRRWHSPAARGRASVRATLRGAALWMAIAAGVSRLRATLWSWPRSTRAATCAERSCS